MASTRNQFNGHGHRPLTPTPPHHYAPSTIHSHDESMMQIDSANHPEPAYHTSLHMPSSDPFGLGIPVLDATLGAGPSQHPPNHGRRALQGYEIVEGWKQDAAGKYYYQEQHARMEEVDSQGEPLEAPPAPMLDEYGDEIPEPLPGYTTPPPRPMRRRPASIASTPPIPPSNGGWMSLGLTTPTRTQTHSPPVHPRPRSPGSDVARLRFLMSSRRGTSNLDRSFDTDRVPQRSGTPPPPRSRRGPPGPSGLSRSASPWPPQSLHRSGQPNWRSFQIPTPARQTTSSSHGRPRSTSSGIADSSFDILRPPPPRGQQQQEIHQPQGRYNYGEDAPGTHNPGSSLHFGGATAAAPDAPSSSGVSSSDTSSHLVPPPPPPKDPQTSPQGNRMPFTFDVPFTSTPRMQPRHSSLVHGSPDRMASASKPSAPPPPSPPPPPPIFFPDFQAAAAAAAHDYDPDPLATNVRLVEIATTSVDSIHTFFTSVEHQYDVRLHTQMCKRVKTSLLAVAVVLQRRQQFPEEQIRLGSKAWQRKYTERLASLQRTLQKLCKFVTDIENHHPKLKTIDKGLDKLSEYDSKLTNLASKFNSLFDRIRVRHLHAMLVQAHAEAQEARSHARSARDLPGWAAGKARRAELRKEFMAWRGRGGRRAALVS
ncbi:hypothetical protein Hypma_007414 [Hypsizygus marmoreus]|uniref:Uncharacterized protein n=1 Tax=Hypsizygus marmoreus TaxID=39966 RepID=A0A369JX06_HYPMA|nr:hypothetical protein Hypma_007414 [Hypsizygus marmoreus]